MRARIVLSILAAFIIAFSLLSLSLFLYHYNFDEGKWVLREDSNLLRQISFLSHDVPVNQKKIFIIGSSHVVKLNPTLIRDDLQENKLNYTIYNLATSADVPSLRLKTINFIISAKPSMVVYGISDRDFRIHEGLTNENDVNLLPNIHDALGDRIDMQIANSKIDTDYLSSPKWDFLKFTFGINNTHNFNQDGNFDPSLDNIWSEEHSKYIVSEAGLAEEKLNFDTGPQQMLPLDENKNFLAFKTIIGKLQDNEIPVIIFVTPQQKHRLEKLPEINQFNLALNNILKEFPDVPIYSLWTKYAELTTIWTDTSHVVANTKKTGRIYSDDVAKMITAELGVHKGEDNDLTNEIPPKFSGELNLFAKPLFVSSFPISNSTLMSIWKEKSGLQKAFPEVANGNLDKLKKWAWWTGWNVDERLAALIPPGQVPLYLQKASFPISNSTLMSIWKERSDLQKAFPEVANGNLDNLKKWATTYGWNEDKRLATLTPTEKVTAAYTGNKP